MNLHKEPKTQRDLETLRAAVRQQLDQVMWDPSWVSCATCGLKCPLWKMYRCYFCGLWVCENCAPKHFSKKRSLMVEYPVET